MGTWEHLLLHRERDRSGVVVPPLPRAASHRRQPHDGGVVAAHAGAGDPRSAPVSRRAEVVRHALRHFYEAGDVAGITLVLDDLAIVAVGLGDPERAGRLWGAARHLQQRTGTGLADYVQQNNTLFGMPTAKDAVPARPARDARCGRRGDVPSTRSSRTHWRSRRPSCRRRIRRFPRDRSDLSRIPGHRDHRRGRPGAGGGRDGGGGHSRRRSRDGDPDLRELRCRRWTSASASSSAAAATSCPAPTTTDDRPAPAVRLDWRSMAAEPIPTPRPKTGIPKNPGRRELGMSATLLFPNREIVEQFYVPIIYTACRTCYSEEAAGGDLPQGGRRRVRPGEDAEADLVRDRVGARLDHRAHRLHVRHHRGVADAVAPARPPSRGRRVRPAEPALRQVQGRRDDAPALDRRGRPGAARALRGRRSTARSSCTARCSRPGCPAKTPGSCFPTRTRTNLVMTDEPAGAHPHVGPAAVHDGPMGDPPAVPADPPRDLLGVTVPRARSSRPSACRWATATSSTTATSTARSGRTRTTSSRPGPRRQQRRRRPVGSCRRSEGRPLASRRASVASQTTFSCVGRVLGDLRRVSLPASQRSSRQATGGRPWAPDRRLPGITRRRSWWGSSHLSRSAGVDELDPRGRRRRRPGTRTRRLRLPPRARAAAARSSGDVSSTVIVATRPSRRRRHAAPMKPSTRTDALPGEVAARSTPVAADPRPVVVGQEDVVVLRQEPDRGRQVRIRDRRIRRRRSSSRPASSR